MNPFSIQVAKIALWSSSIIAIPALILYGYVVPMPDAQTNDPNSPALLFISMGLLFILWFAQILTQCLLNMSKHVPYGIYSSLLATIGDLVALLLWSILASRNIGTQPNPIIIILILTAWHIATSTLLHHFIYQQRS